MTTKISFQTYSGGDGSGDPQKLLGIVAENPQDVLRACYTTHDIYHYLDLYRPVDWNFPNNVEGLVIELSNEEPTASLPDVLTRASTTRNERNEKVFRHALEYARDWHIKSIQDHPTSPILTAEERRRFAEHIRMYQQQINEVAMVTVGEPMFSIDDTFPVNDAVNWEQEAVIWKNRFERACEQRDQYRDERDALQKKINNAEEALR